MSLKIINRIYYAIFPTVQARRIKPWVENNGDKTLRLDYDELGQDSVVFDLGGYEGQWASDIYSMYNCDLYIFEPYKVFADRIINRFKKNNKIKVFDFGLGSEDKEEKFGIFKDSSSTFKVKIDSKNVTTIPIHNVINFFKSNDIAHIDLVKINIEGGEYELLETLIHADFIKKIRNIQVQFHDFVPNSSIRMKNIQNELAKTHKITYQYEYVWENWKLIESII